MDSRISGWLTETDLTPGEANVGLDRLLRDFPATPQAKPGLLRRLDRDEGAGRRSNERRVQRPKDDHSHRLVFSASGIAVALALLVVVASFIDRDGPLPNAGASSSHRVAADGSGDFTTIQAAVDAAASGDTISIAPGTYEESVTVDKDLTVKGDPEDPARVVIVAQPTVAAPAEVDAASWPEFEMQRSHGFLVTNAAVSVSGLTVEVPVAATGIGSMGGRPLFERVWIVGTGIGDLTGNDWYALGFYGETSPTIRDSRWDGYTAVRDGAAATFEGNTISQGLLSIDGPGQSVVRRNTFLDAGGVNTTGAVATIEGNDFTGGSITVDVASIVEVRSNVFFDLVGGDGSRGTAIVVQDVGSRAIVVGNTVTTSGHGIWITGGAAADIRGNTLTTDVLGINVRGAGRVVIDGNRIDGEGVGITLSSSAPIDVTDNTIDVSGRGIAIGGSGSPTIEGNTICGAERSIYFFGGTERELGENDVC